MWSRQGQARSISHLRLFPLDTRVVLGKLGAVYRNLDADKIVETIRLLQNRIQERFPEAGLGRVASDLLHVAERAGAKSKQIAKPYLPFRVGIALLVMLFLVIGGWITLHVK